MSQLCKECGCDAEGLVSSLDEMDTLLGEAQAEIERLRPDAERWRDFPRRLNAFWDNCRKESGGRYILVSLLTLQKHLIDAARDVE